MYSSQPARVSGRRPQPPAPIGIHDAADCIKRHPQATPTGSFETANANCDSSGLPETSHRAYQQQQFANK
jgi:hypothetical protein